MREVCGQANCNKHHAEDNSAHYIWIERDTTGYSINPDIMLLRIILVVVISANAKGAAKLGYATFKHYSTRKYEKMLFFLPVTFHPLLRHTS